MASTPHRATPEPTGTSGATIAIELKESQVKWFVLAGLQTLFYLLLFAADVGSLLYFIEPLLVVMAAIYVTRTGSHKMAIAMLCYIIGVLAIAVVLIFIQLIDAGFTSKAVLEALHPLHRIKEFVEIWVMGAAIKNVELTSK